MASTTFCWLPPESWRTICSGPRARMPKRVIASRARRALLAASRRRAAGDAVEDRQRDVLARWSAAGSAPAGRDPPAHRRCRGRAPAAGLRIVTGLPSSRISPEVAGVMPKMVSASSVRPEPTSPAMPRISPARRGQGDVADRVAEGEVRAARGRSRRGTVSAFGKSWSIARPTIIETRSASVDLADRPGADMGAVAQHRDPVGEREDLRQLVADIDDADAALAQAPDHVHQPARRRHRPAPRSARP